MKKTIILIGIAIAVLTGCSSKEHHGHTTSTFSVTKPLLKDTLIYHSYVGQIHSHQHIELRALESGYLQKIYVDEGQMVRKGQLLFQIMPVLYNAETKRAQAEVSFAEIEYANTKALADSNIVSRNELALVLAKLQKARAELELAQAHLGFTEIKAPFDGIVGRFNDVRLGSLVDEGELLTTLSDNSKMWVYFNVPEAEYLDYVSRKKLDSMMQVRLLLANNSEFESLGKVETIVADFNNETGNIAFRATFVNPNGILRNGETGNVLVPVPLKKAILVPQRSTFEILDKKYVFVVSRDTVKLRHITTGAEMPHLYSIISGLSARDTVLYDGIRKVKNGDRIEYEMLDSELMLSKLDQLHAE